VQIFLAVGRAGTLTAAAEQLQMNHSTVYRRINGLETNLRVRLFDRSAGRYQLTEAGEAAYPHAQHIEAEMLSLLRAVEGQDDKPSGDLTLTAPEATLRMLTPHLATFREQYERINLHVRFSDRYFDLSRKEADIALRPTTTPPEDMFGRKIADLAWTVYAPADITLSEAQNLPWGVYGQPLSTRLMASRWRRQNTGQQPVLLSVNSVPAMVITICTARCRGMLPCFVGDTDPNIQRLRPPIAEASSALWLLVHPDLRTTTRIRAMLDHLWDRLRNDVDLMEGRRPLKR